MIPWRKDNLKRNNNIQREFTEPYLSYLSDNNNCINSALPNIPMRRQKDFIESSTRELVLKEIQKEIL